MHRGKRLIPFLLLAPERNISCDIFEIRFSESHGCFCPCSHATRGQSCRELRRNRSHLWRAPTDNVLEIETSSSERGWRWVCSHNQLTRVAAWRRRAGVKRQPVCVLAQISMYCWALNFPGELRDKRALIKRAGGGEGEGGGSVSFHPNFQEWYTTRTYLNGWKELSLSITLASLEVMSSQVKEPIKGLPAP